MGKHRTMRRGLLGTGAALLLVGTPAAGPAKAEELDGELFAACAGFERAEARLHHIDTHPLKLPFGDPRVAEREEEINRINDAWDDALEGVAVQPIRTPEGLRAKAQVARDALHRRFCRRLDNDFNGEAEAHLAWSVLGDVLGRVGA